MNTENPFISEVTKRSPTSQRSRSRGTKSMCRSSDGGIISTLAAYVSYAGFAPPPSCCRPPVFLSVGF